MGRGDAEHPKARWVRSSGVDYSGSGWKTAHIGDVILNGIAGRLVRAAMAARVDGDEGRHARGVEARPADAFDEAAYRNCGAARNVRIAVSLADGRAAKGVAPLLAAAPWPRRAAFDRQRESVKRECDAEKIEQGSLKQAGGGIGGARPSVA